MENIFSLDRKLALITGGGSGIGKAVADCMVKAGASVIITGRHEDTLKAACNEIGENADYLVQDVTDMEKASEFVCQVQEKFGLPDIIVNNAGIHLKETVENTSYDKLQKVLDTHLVGAVEMTRHFVDKFIDRGSGNIIFITSMAAVFGLPYVSAYSAAKSALLGLVRSYSIELSPKGIRVNAIAPGWIQTPMLDKSMQNDPDRLKKILSRTPKNSLGKPEDIGWAAVYLASDQANFVTGQQLVVDGGVSIGF